MNPTSPESAPAPAFLSGGGAMGRLMRAHDWVATPLGAVEGWPAALRTTLRILLSTHHPVFLFWGAQHVCFYNDAYSRSLGPESHPAMLGTPAQRAWREIWPVIGPQIDSVMAGGPATWHENQLIPITRHGRLDSVYWTYSYGPVDDDTAPGGIGGVLVLCTETTEQVLATQRLADQKRWMALFDQAPGFICMLQGPEHRYSYSNRRYAELTSQRAVPGRTVQDCMPEVAEQGFIALLDEVYRSGVAHVAQSAPLKLTPADGGEPVLRYLDFVYEPTRDEAGRVTGIFVEGHDVTARTLATRELQATLESIADGFAAFDSDWRFVHLNPAAERLVGRSAADLLGRSHWEAFPDTVGTPLQAEYLRAAAGEVRVFEFYFDDVQRHFHLRCYPRAGGGLAVYFQDITRHRQHDAALQASEKQARERAGELEALMGSMPAFVWFAHDRACTRISGNPQSYRLVRMTPDSNPSATPAAASQSLRPFREFRGGVPADPQSLPLQRAARTGQPVAPGELSLVFDDGAVRHLYGGAVPLHDDQGAVRGAVATFVDITELKQAQARLEQRERELRTLTDNTPDVLARFDRAHQLVFVNAAIEGTTGQPPHTLLGRSLQALDLPQPLRERWAAALDGVFDSARPGGFESSFEQNGKSRTHVWRLVPESAVSGRVMHVLALVQDVSEQRRTEQALRDAERRKDEFLATLAHELRNPLAPLRSGLQILEQEVQTGAGAGAGATTAGVRSMMTRQLAQMVRLIDDLLDVSRIAAGKMTLRPEVVTLQSAAETALEACRPALQAGGQRLVLRLASEPVWVHADPARLAQLIGNLLHNAAKYTPEHGTITLTVALDTAPPLLPGGPGEPGRALLQVADTGIGIPPDMLGDVFQMFAQVNHTLHRAQGGLGIGLALARSITLLHGGSIGAHSDGLDQGSVFTCRLPGWVLAAAADNRANQHTNQQADRPMNNPMDANASANANAAAPHPKARPLRVLVVDDNRDAADSLVLLLSLSGHATRAAYDGCEGLQQILAWAPDIAFVDIGMPGMDGYELARTLRGRATETVETAETLRVNSPMLAAVTGWGSESDERRSRDAGFDLHFTKPVALEAVEAVLARLAAGQPL